MKSGKYFWTILPVQLWHDRPVKTIEYPGGHCIFKIWGEYKILYSTIWLKDNKKEDDIGFSKWEKCFKVGEKRDVFLRASLHEEWFDVVKSYGIRLLWDVNAYGTPDISLVKMQSQDVEYLKVYQKLIDLSEPKLYDKEFDFDIPDGIEKAQSGRNKNAYKVMVQCES